MNGHDHPHAGEAHSHDGSGGHTHEHRSRPAKVLRRLVSFARHGHDHHDGVWNERHVGERGLATRQAIRATQIGFIGLAGTALLQTLFVAFTGSVALLADTRKTTTNAAGIAKERKMAGNGLELRPSIRPSIGERCTFVTR